MQSKNGYRDMLREHPHSWCWLCGRGPEDVPSYWHAPFLIERAHLVNKPRSEDRRSVVLLCSACHRVSHGERIAGRDLPPVTLAHLLWLKLQHDPDYYDPGFLRVRSVRSLPALEIPPAAYREEYRRRRRWSAMIP